MSAELKRNEQHWFNDHSREYKENQFVYPVISRRSGGLSIGINLNQNSTCNYQCLYCQVDHKTTQKEPDSPIWLSVIEGEIVALIHEIQSGKIWEHPKFKDVPPALRVLKDIAFSGNGEPTMAPLFEQVATRLGNWIFPFEESPKIILITNGSQLHQKSVLRALQSLEKLDFEVWFKFDTANEKHFVELHQCKTPLAQVINNLIDSISRFPTRIQTMLYKKERDLEFHFDKDAYLMTMQTFAEENLDPIEVQITTLARATEQRIYAASQRELNDLEFLLQKNIPHWNVKTYL